MVSRGSVEIPLWLIATCLVIVGLLLTAPVSYLLAGAGWTRRSPRPALVLWQAVCLTAGFSVVAGLVLLAVEPFGDTLIGAARNWFAAALTGSLDEATWRLLCGLSAAMISGVLLAVLVRTAVLTVKRRRAHRHVLDLLTTPPERAERRRRLAATSELRILEHRAAVAYTLPGWHSRVVLSAGLVDLLTERELAAVIEHERAHLRARHDLLVLPFQAWAVALGWVPGVRPAGASVAELTEMLADDVAAGRTSREQLASALAKVALSDAASLLPRDPMSQSAATTGPMITGKTIAGKRIAGKTITGPAITGTAVADRVRRLLDPRPLSGRQLALVYLCSLLLLTVPASVLMLRWT